MSQEERWASNTLTRTTGQAYRTLMKARQRVIVYPNPPRVPTIQEPGMHTTVDEAYSSMMASLSTASRNCLRYYRSCSSMEQTRHDRRFCARYLTPQAVERRQRNPNADSEDLQIQVGPGTYSVTAAAHGDGRTRQQTHVIKVGHGETAAVEFTI